MCAQVEHHVCKRPAWKRTVLHLRPFSSSSVLYVAPAYTQTPAVASQIHLDCIPQRRMCDLTCSARCYSVLFYIRLPVSNRST